MHPVLFQLGPFSLRTYGALVAMGFLLAIQLAKRTFGWRGFREHFLMDLAVVLIGSGLLGARLLYVLLNGSYYIEHPFQALKIWEGGLVFYGGFIVASLAGIYFVHKRGESVGAVADCAAPPLALGHAIGRIGCFFAGCCYGKPTDLPWKVTFIDSAALAPLGIGLHPVQLYEAFGNALIAVFLTWQLRKHPKSQGGLFLAYIILYGLLRFAMEFFRSDDRGPMVGGLSPSQLVALGMILIAGSFLAVHASERKKHL